MNLCKLIVLTLVLDTAGYRWCVDLWRSHPSSLYYFYPNLCDTYIHPCELCDLLGSHDRSNCVCHVKLVDVALQFFRNLIV